MPIYEYQCQECGHKLEVMQRMSDERLKTCPDCEQDTLIKLISTVAFQLKGTGWYETDFKNNGKPAAKGDADKDSGDAGKDTDAASKSGGSDDKSSDSGAKSATADSASSAKTTTAKTEKSAAKTAAKPAAE